MKQQNRSFRPRRVPGRLGALEVPRLLVLQVVQVGLFVVLVQPLWVAAIGAALAAVVIIAVFGRHEGRWATEALLLWRRLRRRRGVVGRAREDPRLAVLAELVPDLAVEDIPGPDDTRLGMGSDGAGWFAVLEVEPAEAGVDAPVPTASLARIASESGLAGVVMQVVTHAAPAPSPAGPRQTRLWVAVRLDADLITRSTVDDTDPLDVPAVLVELTRRARRALRRRGLNSRVLDVDGLIDALVLSCDLAGVAPPGQVHERWRAWYSHRLAHRCYWLRQWPDFDRTVDFLARLTELAGAQVSIALVVETEPESASAKLRCLVRVGAPPAQLAEFGAYVEQLAEQAGGSLFALNGEQALAVYGSAPSGGGTR